MVESIQIPVAKGVVRRMFQGQTPGPSQASPHNGDGSAAPGKEQIREELDRVLASHEFRSSKRSQDFLRYVIENTLHGNAGMLKERTIGIEVFGRSTTYEPSDDATVRVKAGEVRKRLGLYYSTEGARDPIRIELPAGTYVPEFRIVPAEVVPAAVAERAAPGRSRFPRSLLAALVLIVAVGAGILWLLSRPSTAPLDEFWSPIVNNSYPTLICAAFVPVYGLDRAPGSTEPVRPGDFVSLTDQFVGGGDLVATSRLTAMLARSKRPYRLKVGNDVSFADLRSSAAILVGYSYTRWKEISSQMRYFIEVSPAYVGITDNGKRTNWNIPNLPRDRRTNEDYAIVSRVFHPDTHAMLVEIAGITQYGTDAASDLVTNPDLMAEAMQGAPADWKSKNLQLVLHAKVISGAPSSPKVVGRYFW